MDVYASAVVDGILLEVGTIWMRQGGHLDSELSECIRTTAAWIYKQLGKVPVVQNGRRTWTT